MSAAAHAPKKDPGKKKKWPKVLIAVGIALALVIGAALTFFFYYFGGLNTKPIDTSDLGIDTSFQAAYKGEPITNIALFGIDARGGGHEGRSDAVIILSVNRKTNGIKLISVMRDSYVQINGRGDKLTHAYAYDGPELAVKTLNENFKLNITDYVTVNFDQLADVIESIGGIPMDISSGEMYEVNRNLSEIGGWPYLEEYGEAVHLTGQQAVAYARIRNIGADQGRTERQRKVLIAMFDKVKTLSSTQYLNLAKTIIPMLTTSLDYSDLISYIPVIASGNVHIDQTMIPGDYDNARDAIIDEIYYMAYDLDLATRHIHDFIYKDIDPNTPPEPETSDLPPDPESLPESE